MSDDLRLGFHRLGQWFEDPFNLAIALLGLWAVFAWIIGVATAMGMPLTLLLVLAGVAAIILARHLVERTARSWRAGRLELEPGARGRGRGSAHPS
jgi:hypothetical protein